MAAPAAAVIRTCAIYVCSLQPIIRSSACISARWVAAVLADNFVACVKETACRGCWPFCLRSERKTGTVFPGTHDDGAVRMHSVVEPATALLAPDFDDDCVVTVLTSILRFHDCYTGNVVWLQIR
ncbi:hypothetical protein K491DRAFT_238362 [Lophiostoma macrostomum CBS 122681]|uniref:Uncharacterized protein n=1 Tax=Lophiostoma macrostomum CBS 122681 TaxID=1314788 RepID=A0A6A6SNV5_9PLEO|nr:hypothetical protein K491DRAFT_238362 [Lophiostoma macrostomum CBS 122681]